MAWTYSDWVTYEVGVADRLTRLRLHMVEVSDAMSGVAEATGQGQGAKRHSGLAAYLESLREQEASLIAASSTGLYEVESIWVP